MRNITKFLVLIFACIAGFYFFAQSPVNDPSKPWATNQIVHLNDRFREFEGVTSLRLVTYNIGYASGIKNNTSVLLTEREVRGNLEAIIKRLTALEADIVCLQEVDFDSARTFNIDMLQELGKRLGFPHITYAVTWNKHYVPFPYWPPQGQFGQVISGQAVLSRLPIEKSEISVFEKPPNAFWYNAFYLDRLAQKVILNLNGKKLAIWNVHLEAFHKPTRIKQAQKLAQMVNATDDVDYKIIAGDFNDPQAKDYDAKNNSAYVFLTTTKMMGDLEYNEDFTFPSWKPIEKIDHIFFGNSFQLQDSGTLDLTASDHRAVWVDLSLTQL